jgi:hypothetical protein
MTVAISRRRALSLIATGSGLAFAGTLAAQTKPGIRMDVYKEPTCGCCAKWVDHMKASGFDARVTDGPVTAIKTKHGVSAELMSCHTGLVDGFVIEGHVPAADVKKLLAQRPRPSQIVGLTIPGMPQSAPGMDVTPFQPYTVLSFDRQGRTTVFARHDRA